MSGGRRPLRIFRHLLSDRGQLIMPAFLVIPTLFIFVYLLFETAKLSREKIRHQFAIDSASFIEMTNASDFLNRTAYVNGPFPHKIFTEAFGCPPNENYVARTDSGKECLYDVFAEMGAYPVFTGSPNDKIWKIQFADKARNNAKLNVEDPDFPKEFELLTYDKARVLEIPWSAMQPTEKDSKGMGIFPLYYQVYMMLGSIETSQYSVYRRLTDNFNFFRKSYYLNTGECRKDPAKCAGDGLNNFAANKLEMKFHEIETLVFHARVAPKGMDLGGLRIYKTEPIKLDPRIFQLATVRNNAVLGRLGRGLEVNQRWEAPDNYFKIDMNNLYKPTVHARVAAQCPNLKNDNNCIWPNPTPKYQTRLYP